MTAHELFCYLIIKEPQKAVEFYTQVFGAIEDFRLSMPDGQIAHCELKLAGTTIMISSEHPQFGLHAPTSEENYGAFIHLHVENADKFAGRAIQAGATLIRPLQDQFWGERTCRIRDPFGYHWMLGHSIENVSPADMQIRLDNMMKSIP